MHKNGPIYSSNYQNSSTPENEVKKVATSSRGGGFQLPSIERNNNVQRNRTLDITNQ